VYGTEASFVARRGKRKTAGARVCSKHAMATAGAEGQRPGAQPLPGKGTKGPLGPSMLANSAQLFKAEGNAAFKAGDYAGALRHYTEAIGVLNAHVPAGAMAAEPADEEMLVVLRSNGSEALYRLGKHEDALEWAQAALAVDPAHKKSLAREAKAEKAIKERVPELLRDPSEHSAADGGVAMPAAAPAAPTGAYRVQLSEPSGGTEAEGRWRLTLTPGAAPAAGRGKVEDVEEEEELRGGSREAWGEPEPEPEPPLGGPGRPLGAGKPPVCAIVVGMAGSGKTTLMQRLNAHLYQRESPGYFINLDPAVRYMPYSPNIDIRDTVNYKEVMEQYNLGPNGGIMTALNLFSTRFDKVMDFVEKRAEQGLEYFLIDTPGQMEIFTWSASGSIITETLASAFPTVIVYVMDTPRNQSSATFMSNMLYACSILYKSKLPMVVAFNKTDVVPADYAMEWMRDSDAFQEALLAEQSDSYMSSLTHSMALVLDEFYATLKAVGVSAMTGEGCDELFEAIDAAAEEYNTEYKPQLDAKVAEREAVRAAAKARQMQKLRVDALVEGDIIDGEQDEDEEVSGMRPYGAGGAVREEEYDEYATESSSSDGSADEEEESSLLDGGGQQPESYGELM
jgi:GTPase SAR1 family protein